MKFLVPEPLTRGLAPQIPVLSVLCPPLNLLNPPPNKIPGYATVYAHVAPSRYFEFWVQNSAQCSSLCVHIFLRPYLVL